MPPTGSTAAQRQPAPHDSGTSYSSRQQQAKNQPDLSGRLVYADPRSLPSFPTVGVKLDSTGTAALTASKVKSPPPILDTSGPVNPASLKAATQAAAAASAALFAKPSTAAKPSSSPEARPRSSPTNEEPSSPPLAENSAAAASASANNINNNANMSTKPSGHSSAGWGNSAATQAFRNSQSQAAKKATAPPEKPIPEIAALGYQPSLRAAKGAMRQAANPGSKDKDAASLSSNAAAASLSGATSAAGGGSSGHTLSMRTRNRAQSSPLTMRQQKSMSSHYPDSTTSSALASSPPDPKVSAANALSAATIAHSASARSRGIGSNRHSYVGDAGSVPYTNMSRQMYTSQPPVGPEVDDQKHADGLHASAIAMAKKMYNPNAEGGASGSGVGGSGVPNVQEQAYKLAQERLEKLHELHAKDREYREHYVDPNLGASGGETSRRLTMRGRLRRRRSSSDSDINADRVRSQEIRNQMSLLSSRISEVEDKRRRDRQNVLLAAQRNVKSQLQDIDEQVYANSGRMPPSVMAKIEPQVNALAQKRADAHIGSYPQSHQVDIGGGKFMERSEVDRIATARMQPIIDDMHEKAQAEHERQAALRQAEEERKEERKAEAALVKARGKEMKDTYKQIKRDEKAARKEEKPPKRHSKILGIPIGFGLGGGAAAVSGAASAAGSATGAATDKAGNIVNGKGKHDADKNKNEANSEAQSQIPEEEMMTAPDTSSSNDTSSLASPTSPAAATGAGVGTAGAGAAGVGAAGLGAKSSSAAPASTTVAADITDGSSLATAPVTQPVTGSSAARDVSPSSAPTGAAMKTGDRSSAPLEKTGSSTSRRLSKLFVKTPKEGGDATSNVERGRTEGSSSNKISGGAVAGAAGAVGAGVASQAKSVVPGTNGHSSGPARTGTTSSTPLSPLSPQSDDSASSNKVKSWLKSRFSRDRSKSSASASGAPSSTAAGSSSGKTAAAAGTGAGVGAAASSGPAAAPSSSTASKALGTSAVSDSQRANNPAERSFVGGHALTGSDSPNRVGTGSLTMPLIAGGALGAAGGATAAGLASKGDSAAEGTSSSAGLQQRDSINSVNQEAYYTPTGSQRQSLADQGGRAKDSTIESYTPGDSGKSGLPESTTGITAAKDSSEKDAAALAQGQPGFESLTPVLMGPAEGTSTAAKTEATTTSGSSGLGAGGVAAATGAAGLAGAAGAAGAGAAGAHSHSGNTGALNAPNMDYTVAGNRASYTSSHYSSEAGVPGAAGSGFGLVGVNMFAHFSGVTPAADKADDVSETTQTTEKGSTFVSVPPPTAPGSGGESGTNAGAFTPPKAIRDPAEKKSASPVRDSRFLENLEEV